MISYGWGWLAKSTNQGLNWTDIPSRIPFFVNKVIYDSVNPEILYSSGLSHTDTILIYRSTDGGNNWHVFYEEIITDSDGVMDMELYDNKLIIYTFINGIYYLNIDEITGIKKNHSENFDIYPNPVSSFLMIKSDIIFDKILIYDVFGRLCKKINVKNEYIDLSDLSSGIYYLSVYSGNNSFIKTIIKE